MVMRVVVVMVVVLVEVERVGRRRGVGRARGCTCVVGQVKLKASYTSSSRPRKLVA